MSAPIMPSLGLTFLFGHLDIRSVLAGLRSVFPHHTSSRENSDDSGDRGKNTAPTPPRPFIKTGSDHNAYALLIVAGEMHDVAAKMVGISPRTAERWRNELREAGRLFFGREKSYEFLARYCLDESWRRLVDGEEPENAAELLKIPAPIATDRNARAARQSGFGTAPNRPDQGR